MLWATIRRAPAACAAADQVPGSLPAHAVVARVGLLGPAQVEVGGQVGELVHDDLRLRRGNDASQRLGVVDVADAGSAPASRSCGALSCERVIPTTAWPCLHQHRHQPAPHHTGRPGDEDPHRSARAAAASV